MMYSEFVEGTGCRDNEHNRKVFENLEAMYMNTEMTKQDVYEYGKKLVDNSKSPEQIEFEEGIKTEIEFHKHRIEAYKSDLSYYKDMLKMWKDEKNNCMIVSTMSTIRYDKEQIQFHRNQIKGLQWVLD